MPQNLNRYNSDAFQVDNPIMSKIRVTEQTILLATNVDYTNFYSDIRLFLRKMPRGPVSDYVSTLINHNGLFIGINKTRPDIPVFQRVLISPDEKLAGVVLPGDELNIDTGTGETDRIDDCIYATYLGMIRASLKTKESTVNADFNLHKLCITYFFNLILKNIGRAQSFSKFKLDGTQLACSYLYFRHYLDYNHASALSRTTRLFADVMDKEHINQIKPSFELASRYKSMKDIGKVLVDLNIVSVNPNEILLALVQSNGRTFFYNLMSAIDYLFGLIILTKYPNNLFQKANTVNVNLQNSIEQIVIQNYLSRLDYSIVNIQI